ncbi:hypothetical protein [Streptomyces sp. NPDC006739]|uniref:hypothetical protein n=1 Tax=Streptomyces sp. NPDC006739 TaxID=3364763 RepID=UPI0036AC4E90
MNRRPPVSDHTPPCSAERITRLAAELSDRGIDLVRVLWSDLHGVERGLVPPPPIRGDRGDEGAPLPTSFGEALTALEQDKALGEALGDRFVRVFTELKRMELARFAQAVTDWEFNEYSWML